MGITEFYSNVNIVGVIRYFKGDRLYNENSLYEFNKGKIKAKEIVTFDSSLMNLQEITKDQLDDAKENEEQVMAVIVRPEIEINYQLEANTQFEFCGYDLVNFPAGFSAITNCGADWGGGFGLLPIK